MSSRDHCGACDSACPPDPPNGIFVCERGECVSGCDPSFGDCDELIETGCETPLVTSAHCGACNAVCEGATPYCVTEDGTSRCDDVCDPPLMECPGGSCVDVMSDVTNCGSCGNVCPSRPSASSTCADGACGFTCQDGFADCDGSAGNGCETSLDSVDDCGVCDNQCMRAGSVASCVSRACRYTCMTGLGDCDGDGDNGCEQPLTTRTHCGACGAGCNLPGASETCSTGTCEIVSCNTDRADCDGVTSNGCEADLTTAATCGSCGMSCGGGETCSAGVCCPSGWMCITGCGTREPCTCSSGDDCAYRCDDSCEIRCQDTGTECTTVAFAGEPAIFECQSGATCTFDARGATDVTGFCQNNDTSCTYDCRGTDSCIIDCNSSAECELLCDPGDMSCRFGSCSSVNDCGGGRYRCGYAC